MPAPAKPAFSRAAGRLPSDRAVAGFHAAAKRGDTAAVASFLRRYSDGAVDLRDSSGWTALIGAANYGQKEVAALLLRHGADIEARIRGGMNALSTAALIGHAGVVGLLLKAGAEVNAGDSQGWTPLMYSLYPGQKKIARMLLEHGADLDARDNDGCTALELAWTRGQGRQLVPLLQGWPARQKRLRQGKQRRDRAGVVQAMRRGTRRPLRYAGPLQIPPR